MVYPSNYRDNGAKAGGTFVNGEDHVIFHNTRVGHIPDNVTPELSYLNEYSCSWEQTIELENDYLAQAQMNYTLRTGQKKMQCKAPVKEICFTMRKEHTMEDAERAVKMIEEMFGIRRTQVTIHRDEGYINEQGEFVANIHVHARFFILDPETGKSQMAHVHPYKLVLMQTKLAEILNMTPGVKGKKQKHVSSSDYRRIVKRVEDEFKEQLGGLGLDEVKDLKKFQDYVLKYMKAQKKELKADEVDLEKAFKDFLDENSKQSAKTLAKHAKNVSMKGDKPEIPAYYQTSSFYPVLETTAQQMQVAYQAGYNAGINDLFKDFEQLKYTTTGGELTFTSEYAEDKPLFKAMDQITDYAVHYFNQGVEEGKQLGYWVGFNEQQTKIDALEQEIDQYKQALAKFEAKQEIELNRKTSVDSLEI